MAGTSEPLLAILDRYPKLVPTMLEHHGWRVPEDAQVDVAINPGFVSPLFPPGEGIERSYHLRVDDAWHTIVLVEVLRRKDETRRSHWPLGVAEVWRRTGLPVVLLLICPDDEVAGWAERPLVLGPSATITPMVVSPRDHPAIDAECFGRAERAALAALLHSNGPEAELWLSKAVDTFGEGATMCARYHAENLDDLLPYDGRELMQRLMRVSARSGAVSLCDRYVGEGRREATVDAVSAILEARGFELPKGFTDFLASRDDPGLVVRALTATCPDDLRH